MVWRKTKDHILNSNENFNEDGDSKKSDDENKNNGTKTARHSRHTPSHYPNVAYARDPLIRCTHVQTLHQQIAIVAKSMVIATVRVAVSMLDVVVVVVLVAVVYHAPDICGGRN